MMKFNMWATSKTYRSLNGGYYFRFSFVIRLGRVDVYCTLHPDLAGRDPSVTKTHLYSSGQICFQPGREPRSQSEAEHRARQWAEYFLLYRDTGVAGA